MEVVVQSSEGTNVKRNGSIKDRNCEQNMAGTPMHWSSLKKDC